MSLAHENHEYEHRQALLYNCSEAPPYNHQGIQHIACYIDCSIVAHHSFEGNDGFCKSLNAIQTHLLSSRAGPILMLPPHCLYQNITLNGPIKTNRILFQEDYSAIRLKIVERARRKHFGQSQGLYIVKISFLNLVKVQGKTTMQDTGGPKFASMLRGVWYSASAV